MCFVHEVRIFTTADEGNECLGEQDPVLWDTLDESNLPHVRVVADPDRGCPRCYAASSLLETMLVANRSGAWQNGNIDPLTRLQFRPEQRELIFGCMDAVDDRDEYEEIEEVYVDDEFMVDIDARDFLSTMPEDAREAVVAFFRRYCIDMLAPSELAEHAMACTIVALLERTWFAEVEDKHWLLMFIAWMIECHPAVATVACVGSAGGVGTPLASVLALAEEAEDAQLAHQCFKALKAVNEFRTTVLLCSRATRAILEHMRLSPETFYTERGAAMLYDMVIHAKMNPKDGAMDASIDLLLAERTTGWIAHYDDYVSALADEGRLNGERSAIRSVQGFLVTRRC